METVNAFEEMNRRSEWDRCFERAWERAGICNDKSSVDSVRRKLEEDKEVKDQQRREWDARHAGPAGPPATHTQDETPATTASVPESGNASIPSQGQSSRKRRRLGRRRI